MSKKEIRRAARDAFPKSKGCDRRRAVGTASALPATPAGPQTPPNHRASAVRSSSGRSRLSSFFALIQWVFNLRAPPRPGAMCSSPASRSSFTPVNYLIDACRYRRYVEQEPGLRQVTHARPAAGGHHDMLGDVADILSARGSEGWLVGGSVRDRLSGRDSPDVDVVVADDAAAVAKQVAARLRAPWFTLSERYPTYRVLGVDGHLDLTDVRGTGILDDLAERDFTVNAMAVPTSAWLAARVGSPGHAWNPPGCDGARPLRWCCPPGRAAAGGGVRSHLRRRCAPAHACAALLSCAGS